MGDPVTMAMIGAAVGGTYGAATGKDPLKSAMMGAAVGGGGALMGAGGLGAFGAKGAGAASATQAAGIAAQPALSYGGVNTAAGSSMAASPSLLSSFTGGLQGLNTFANQNPFAASIGLQAAGSLLTPPPPTPMAPPPGLARGQQLQMEQPMYGMAPQQPISLI